MPELDLDVRPNGFRATDDASIWRSHGGSRYLFDGDAFICISVHSAEFIGWVGRRAVEIVWRAGANGIARQAFRNPGTGALTSWVTISLRLQSDVVTKVFPRGPLPGRLVHGPVERYVRCRETDIF